VVAHPTPIAERRSLVPRAGLSPQRVIDAACDLADESGMANLTMALLAKQLGVRQPSLYNHVDGMPALLRGIAIQAKHELADVLAWSTMGRSGTDAVRALAGAYREWALQHPGRYEATVPAPASGDAEDEQASGRVREVFLTVLSGCELRGEEELVHAHRAARAALHGFVAREAGGALGIPVDPGESFDFLIDIFLWWLQVRSSAVTGTSQPPQSP
jgi:AcrR family transcriptional regulator